MELKAKEEKKEGGLITVFTAGMFGCKSGYLLEEIAKTQHANEETKAFTHANDPRRGNISSRMHSFSFPAPQMGDSFEILGHIGVNTKNVAIEEAQFFDRNLPTVVKILHNAGINVMIAGLDLTSEGTPFGPMPDLLAMADEVIKLRTVCRVCGSRFARKTACMVEKKGDVLASAEQDTATYEARCNKEWCFQLTADEKAGIDALSDGIRKKIVEMETRNIRAKQDDGAQPLLPMDHDSGCGCEERSQPTLPLDGPKTEAVSDPC